MTSIASSILRSEVAFMAEKLGIYIHIPFCKAKCDYCDFYSRH